jgi:hypothetical protein
MDVAELDGDPSYVIEFIRDFQTRLYPAWHAHTVGGYVRCMMAAAETRCSVGRGCVYVGMRECKRALDDAIRGSPMTIETIANVLPSNSTVLGYDNSVDYWPRLRFQDAIARTKNPIVALIAGQSAYDCSSDVHLSVPYEEEGDEKSHSADLAWYRVRPKDDSVVRAEMIDGEWMWVHANKNGERNHVTCNREAGV